MVSFSPWLRSLLLASALCIPAQSVLAAAQEGVSGAQIQELLKRLAAQESRLKDQEAQISRLQKQMSVMQESRDAGDAAGLKPAAGKAQTPQKNQPQQRQTASSGTPEEVGTDRKQQPKEKPPQIAAVIEEGGVLLRKGQLVITPQVEYSRSSATRVAIEGFSIIPALNIGAFEVSEVDRDTFTGAVGARLGVTNRLEIEGKIPYLYRNDATRTRPFGIGSSQDELSEVTGDGIGDVEVGAHYQINRGLEGWPFFVANLRFKTATGESPFDVPIDRRGLQTELPTGSGFYALQPSITTIYPSDPVVFYSNIGYLFNFKRDFGGTYGEIDPGDSISTSFGMSLALNDRSSVSVGYSHNTVFKTKQNGQTIPNSTFLQVGSLDLGFSYNLSPKINLNLAVSAGLTDDAPDSRVIFRVPLSFDVF